VVPRPDRERISVSLLRRRRPFAAPHHHRRLGLGLGVAMLAGLLPLAGANAASPRGGAGLQPTIHYEEAAAHADDAISFKPGGRVTVPFTPRSSDRWTVGGHAPRALPAGRLSGRAMRDADAATGALDQPVDGGSTPVGVAAGWTAPDVTPDVELTAKVDPGALRREVFGFLPYWELSDSSTRLDWDKISTVAFFGVGAASDGSLIKRNSDGSTTVGWSGWTSAKMTSVIDAAHASGARVVLTVQSFGWTSSGLARQKSLLGSSTARANLATQIVKAVRDRGADGVNLDFEPLASGYDDEFTALVRKIRSALDAAAPGYQLTFDTTGWIGNYPIEDATAPGGADAIMIMGYDYRSSSASAAGSIAPINSTIYDIADTLARYADRVSPAKLILGVPYYGRAWSTKSDALHSANISGTQYGASATAVYTTARDLAAQYGRRYDPTEAVAWTVYKRETCTSTYGCVTSWRQLYYDDATALKAKYDLVNSKGLRGVGIWALGYDGTRTELYQALKDKFITDSVPPTIKGASLSSDIISPNGDGRFETTTARLSAAAFTSWGYRIQRMSGTTAGPTLRSGTVKDTSPAFTWNGKDKGGAIVSDGRYRLTMWVADASGNRTDKGFGVTVDTTRPKVTTVPGYGFFSPDGNGHNDTAKLSWASSQAIHGTVRMIDANGTYRRLWKYGDSMSWKGTWDGRDDAGTKLPNGRYTYRVNGRDRAGNLRIVDKTVLVDDTIKVHSWSASAFDPRAGATSRLTMTLRRSATVNVAIYLGSTKIRAIWTNKSMATGPHGWTWNGKTSGGTYVKAAKYKIVMTATSRYGTTRWTQYVTVQPH
jgi:spore germination protein YaaH/flagellar hook assembly protein FlgD